MKNNKDFVNDFAYLMVKYYEPFLNEFQADDALTDILKLLDEKYNIKKEI